MGGPVLTANAQAPHESVSQNVGRAREGLVNGSRPGVTRGDCLQSCQPFYHQPETR